MGVTTLASVRPMLMLDIFVVTMVDMVGSVDTLVDSEDLDVVTTLASVRLKQMLDILVDSMVDLLVTVETMVDMVATLDTLDKLLNRRTYKELLSPIKNHTFNIHLNKLDKT